MLAPMGGAATTPEPPRPWYERAEAWVGVAVVGACCLFVLFQLQPHLLLRNTTPAGGDTGAHVWWPAYLRDHLLPQWRVAGWSPDFYGGFPAGQFYFPLPALLIVALDGVLPYNVAFKLVTALGPVALPAAAYAFGRGLRAPRPAPALMAVTATAFLFFRGDPGTDSEAMTAAFNQRIMGGTLASTLAGEFSFTIALALALGFLGALAWSLEHRRRLWLPAALLASTILSHLVVGVFALVGALVVWLARRPGRSLAPVLAVGSVGALLTAVWTFPLVATLGYTTDMGYETITEYLDYLFPSYLWWLLPLVGAAVVAGVVRRRVLTLELVALTAAMGVVFRLWGTFDTPAWNLRVLPFWYLGWFLLAGLGAGELLRGAGALAVRTVDDQWWERSTEDGGDPPREAPEASSAPPGPSRRLVRAGTVAVLTAVVATAGLWRVHDTRAFLSFWVRWNYTGYERAGVNVSPTGKSYTEYRAVVDALDDLPAGRALWEPSSGIGSYGTPLALMLLPYLTDGRIASMEGVYYESAASTPYHFLTVATLTAPGNASNPVRGLPYRDINDFDLGVRYLQLLGVRYYMAQSFDAKRRADAHPALELVAQTPDLDAGVPAGWNVYEVTDRELVVPLRAEPVVVEGVGLDDWRDDVAVPWFDDPAALDRVLVSDGPSAWKRSDPDRAPSQAREQLPATTVSDIRATDDSVSFRVSRPGVPVLVKTSYFPNWEASGADGPWRATPNLMVVLPTQREVRLEYRTSGVEALGRAATVTGLLGLGALVWWRPGRRRDAERKPIATPAVP